MSFLIDTHTHLDFKQYDADRDDVILRAEEANVKAMITIGIDLITSKRAIRIAEDHENIFAAVGIHPHDVAEATEEDVLELEQLTGLEKVVAIGEVGLDFYRNLSPADLQRKFFRMFLDWAIDTKLPLIIHTRAADEDILSLIREKSKSGWRGVFHCFSGGIRMAQQVLDMGFHISFTGNITFKNSRAAEVLKTIPLDRLLVETDCPFLTPVPHRGKRNEPAFVNLVAQKMAELKQVPADEVARITSRNAIELFDLPIRLDE